MVDLASLREEVAKVDPKKINLINPQVPVELVIDHSIQVDRQGTKEALKFNEEREFLDVNTLPLPARHKLPLGRYKVLNNSINTDLNFYI